jgi:hypothetical protein
MKISKFVWSVLIAFVAVGLVAPQQARAVFKSTGFVILDGSGDVTPPEPGGKFEHMLTLSQMTCPLIAGTGGRLTGSVQPGASAIFKPISWTGIGASTVLKGGQL